MGKRWAWIIVLMCGLQPLRGFADVMTPQKRAAIQQLLQIANAKAMGIQMASAYIRVMVRQVHMLRPDIPIQADEIVSQEVTRLLRERMNGLIDRLIPIYGRYYTLSDIQAMIAYHKSPLGQKILRVTPLLTRDSIQAGEQWGRDLGPVIAQRVLLRLQQNHLLPSPSPATDAVPPPAPAH